MGVAKNEYWEGEEEEEEREKSGKRTGIKGAVISYFCSERKREGEEEKEEKNLYNF